MGHEQERAAAPRLLDAAEAAAEMEARAAALATEAERLRQEHRDVVGDIRLLEERERELAADLARAEGAAAEAVFWLNSVRNARPAPPAPGGPGPSSGGGDG